MVSFWDLGGYYWDFEGISALLLEVESLTSGRRAAIYLKNSCMLTPVLALTSLKRTLFF
jgi:hypothetical protein